MKKYLFCSYPDFSDNSRSLFDYMVEKNFQGKYIWLYSSDNSIDHFKKVLELKGHKDVKLVKKNTIHGLYHYLTANYLFVRMVCLSKFQFCHSKRKSTYGMECH